MLSVSLDRVGARRRAVPPSSCIRLDRLGSAFVGSTENSFPFLRHEHRAWKMDGNKEVFRFGARGELTRTLYSRRFERVVPLSSFFSLVHECVFPRCRSSTKGYKTRGDPRAASSEASSPSEYHITGSTCIRHACITCCRWCFGESQSKRCGKKYSITRTRSERDPLPTRLRVELFVSVGRS